MDAKRKSHYTFWEELANTITHGIGAALSIVALVLMVVYAAYDADPWRIVSVSIFGATLFLLYLASTLYHGIPHPGAKDIMRVLDHCAIYLLIAGTYTPVLLISMRESYIAWLVFGLLWGVAITGCAAKFFFSHVWQHPKGETLSLALYIAMGWTVLLIIKPALEMVPVGALIMLAVGGIAYTAGTIFYVWDRLPYNHAIWHVFVLAGSLLHFLAVFYYILPLPTPVV